MDGGDLKTLNGGDLKTLSRQHGGIFGLLGKLFGLGVEKQHGGITIWAWTWGAAETDV